MPRCGLRGRWWRRGPGDLLGALDWSRTGGQALSGGSPTSGRTHSPQARSRLVSVESAPTATDGSEPLWNVRSVEGNGLYVRENPRSPREVLAPSEGTPSPWQRGNVPALRRVSRQTGDEVPGVSRGGDGWGCRLSGPPDKVPCDSGRAPLRHGPGGHGKLHSAPPGRGAMGFARAPFGRPGSCPPGAGWASASCVRRGGSCSKTPGSRSGGSPCRANGSPT